VKVTESNRQGANKIKKRTWQRILAKGKKLKTPPCVFLLPPQPKPGDKRPRNAFGFLLGFGKAYAEFYRRQDEANAKKANEIPPDNGTANT